MSDEKVIEYDYESTLSLVGGLQTFCGLMAGFGLTSATVFITSPSVNPSTLLSQTAVFLLFTLMELFIVAFNELTFMSLLASLHSPKPIVPIYPARWRIVNTCVITGTFLGSLSIPVMLLLMNLIPLFVLEMIIQALLWIWFAYRWSPVNRTWKRRTRVQLRSIEASHIPR